MKRKLSLFGAILILVTIPIGSSSGQELGSWELGINYPGEDSGNPFQISSEGAVSVEFFVENSGLTEITVQFEYDIPFGGNSEGPEEESIASGTNKTFDLKISGVDVHSFEAEKKEKFSISGTIISRQGVPDPTSSSQNREGDLEIPTIFDISVEISEPFGPMNAGSDTILTVTVRNEGNGQDGIGRVEVEDNCPLLTSDNGLDSLTIGNIESGMAKDAELRVTASESHPKRHCDITVTVESKRALNQGINVMAQDEVRVSVEPPPTGSDDSDNNENGLDQTEDSIRSNLSAPGFFTLIVAVFLSLVMMEYKSEEVN